MKNTRWYHLYRLGHSITVNRYISVPLNDATSKGWLFKCECGGVGEVIDERYPHLLDTNVFCKAPWTYDGQERQVARLACSCGSSLDLITKGDIHAKSQQIAEAFDRHVAGTPWPVQTPGRTHA